MVDIDYKSQNVNLYAIQCTHCDHRTPFFILISPVVSHQEIFGEYDGHSESQPFRVDLREHMADMPNRLPIPGRDAVWLLCAGFIGLSHIRRRK